MDTQVPWMQRRLGFWSVRFLKLLPEPSQVIGDPNNPYLVRWRLFPVWLAAKLKIPFNVYLHLFLNDDDDRALHDHPWPSCSLILTGGYIEHVAIDDEKIKSKPLHRATWTPYFRKATDAHRIELFKRWSDVWMISEPIPTWSLFFIGNYQRSWGFWCKKGFVPWREYVADTPGGNMIGKGCDE